MTKAAAVIVGLMGSAIMCAVPAEAQKVTKEPVAGVVNFARAETTVACGGAVTPEGLAEVKKLGFVSVFNLRLANEPGNDVVAEEAAARAAGLKFAHIPVNSAALEPAVADKFLETITTPGYQPAFIHCGGGGRAATMWFIKRLVVDGWDVEKATAEATALGMGTGRVKDFALEYARTHKK
jgi:uncharacterized protein (TIGR01244 family)